MTNKIKRLILFSVPTPEVMEQIIPKMFPDEMENKRFAYLPVSNKLEKYKEYIDYWKNLIGDRAEFIFIDSSKRGDEAKEEIKKLLSCNVLLITGGNTFTLLNDLRESGLFDAIKEFFAKDSYVYAGFSAGAVIVSPRIDIAGYEGWTFGKDENYVGIKDTTGLGIIDFEVLPHAEPEDAKTLEKYRKTAQNVVRTVSNDEFIIIEK